MMTLKKTFLGTLLGALALVTAHAADYTPDQLKQIEEFKKTYPLTTCVVSGDKLGGDMGQPIEMLYTQKAVDGKETARLVRFCCAACPRKFNKDPEKYLQALDAAAAEKGTKAAK